MVQSQTNITKKRKTYNRRTRKYKKTKGGASNEDMQNVNISQPTIATSLDTINNTQLPTQTQEIQEQPVQQSVQQPVQQKTKKGKRKKANKKKKTGEPCINDDDCANNACLDNKCADGRSKVYKAYKLRQQQQPQAQEGQPQAQEVQPQAQEGQPQAQEGQPQTQEGQPQAQEVQPQAQEEQPQAQEEQPQAQEDTSTSYERNNISNIKEKSDDYDYLYPHIDDPDFNIKIASKKEFFDTRYDGDIYDLEEHSDKLCNAEFELTPHQLFVRNFLSFQTPYNSLLLYHGLGTGKTCSAIGIGEETRDYNKQMGILKRIIIVASPNVQNNFKLQLFDERKLELVDGLWNIKVCTGNKFIKEINPMNMKGLSKENVSKQINRIIKNSYLFLGYIEFANYIQKQSKIDVDVGEKRKKTLIKNKLKKDFNNRLIIIDEVHNIRITDDNENKRVAIELTNLIKSVDNLKLLLLSATPMYNNYKEILWLVNLMNMNDNRPEMNTKDVFNNDGSFVTDDDGNEIGKELLERKATGYVSFVRGDNPYTFPYRIWPSSFSPENSYEQISKPDIQLNGAPIIQNLKFIEVYLSKIGSEQQKGYDYTISKIKGVDTPTTRQITVGDDVELDMSSIRPLETDVREEESEEEPEEEPQEEPEEEEKKQSGGTTVSESIMNNEPKERFGYTELMRPIEALNMIYPNDNLGKDNTNVNIKSLVGTEGLKRMINFEESGSPMRRKNFNYKTEKYGRIFSPNELGKYSGKIKSVCDNIMNSTGVVLVYSQYIDGGVIPIALALEELGFTRAEGMNSLFETPPTNKIDAVSMKEKQSEEDEFNPAKYIMITGDKSVSPNNLNDLKMATGENNVDGKQVKVILISQAGSEGLDFKFIRQVHILEPWWNMNRVEQIIGRAVRTCSHKALPFSERNVEIYLHGSLTDDERKEAADIYVYRLAEVKALKIGQVSRLLKSVAVDCLLNSEQQNFSEENFDKVVTQKLSSNKEIEYKIGDKPFTAICDYMEKCDYVCKPNATILEANTKLDTYGEEYINVNNDKIIKRIKMLMKENFFYRKEDLISRINVVNEYPISQINSALHQLVEGKNEYITDKYNRLGYLINIGDLYLFQPLEINDKKISVFERSTPLEYKKDRLTMTLSKPEKEETIITSINDENINTVTISNNLIKEIKAKYDLANNTDKIKRGESDWYRLASVVLQDLRENNIEHTNDVLISHILEEINFDGSINILNYLQLNEELSDFEKLIKKYYDDKIIENDKIKSIILNKNGNEQLVKLEDNKWIDGQPEDYNKISGELTTRFEERFKNVNTLIGIMSVFKKNEIVFKIRNISNKRDTGARCDQAQKSHTLKILDEVASFEYNKKLNQKQLCILEEFIFRIHNKNKKDNKVWFLSPVENILYNKKD